MHNALWHAVPEGKCGMDVYVVFFALVTHYSNVILYCGYKLKCLLIYIPLELLIKYEHSNGNLECLDKLSALIAVQHTDVVLLSVQTTRYYIP